MLDANKKYLEGLGPTKVAFFTWTVAIGRILMMNNLLMRNIFTVDIAQDLWSMVLCLFGIYWIMPKRVVDLLACWKGNFGRQQRSKVSTTRIMNKSSTKKAIRLILFPTKK